MSTTSKIEWTNHTGGPYLGCSIFSPGCTNCYAKALAESRLEPIFRRAYQAAGFKDWKTRPVWGDKATRVLSKGFWTDAVRINRQHATAGTRGRWFPSMIDWLDDMPAGIIDQAGKALDPTAVLADFLKLIHDTPSLDWLLLTKRTEHWMTRVNGAYHFMGEQHHALLTAHPDRVYEPALNVMAWLSNWLGGHVAPANIWPGASVEDQPRADERIPELLKLPAKVRFLSLEPLLAPVDLTRVVVGAERVDYDPLRGKELPGPYCKDRIDWVIIGGESGPGARPCNVEWIRDIVRQCKVAGVPCFVKQLGSKPYFESKVSPAAGPMDIELKHPKGGDLAEWPEDLRVRQFPSTLNPQLPTSQLPK